MATTQDVECEVRVVFAVLDACDRIMFELRPKIDCGHFSPLSIERANLELRSCREQYLRIKDYTSKYTAQADKSIGYCEILRKRLGSLLVAVEYLKLAHDHGRNRLAQERVDYMRPTRAM
jgi:hypothetical protein